MVFPMLACSSESRCGGEGNRTPGRSLRAIDSVVENTPWKNSLQGLVLSYMEIREILAHNLRTHRLAQGLSQEELAHRAGVDRTYVSSLERSVYAAGIDVVDSLAKVLGIEASDLLRKPESATPEPVNDAEKG